MAAYVIVDIDVHDPVGYEEYKKLSGAAVAQYGGRFLARGGKVEQMEGDWLPARAVIIEFPSVEQAKRWHTSPEYTEAKEIRWRTARTRMIVVAGM